MANPKLLEKAFKAIGKPLARKEDGRLITGKGRFTDDFNLPNQTWTAMVRSPYPHARIVSIDPSAALEMPVDNVAWPDLFERQERIFFICLALVCQGLFGSHLAAAGGIIPPALWLLAILTHVTALQRFLRAKTLLQKGPGDGKAR